MTIYEILRTPYRRFEVALQCHHSEGGDELAVSLSLTVVTRLFRIVLVYHVLVKRSLLDLLGSSRWHDAFDTAVHRFV